MKTKSDIIFNIIKCLPFVAYGMAIVFSIINRHYDWAVMNACLVVVYILVLALISKLESAMADAYKKAYERECELFEKEALILRKEILDEAVDSKKLAEDMLRIFNNVDKMYKRYEDRD